MGDLKLDNENQRKANCEKSKYFVDRLAIDLADQETEISEIKLKTTIDNAKDENEKHGSTYVDQ